MPKISYSNVKLLCQQFLTHKNLGVPVDEAGAVAAQLQYAQASDSLGHGMIRLPRYGQAILDNELVLGASPTIKEMSSYVHVDGTGEDNKRMLGQWVLDCGMKVVLDQLKSCPVVHAHFLGAHMGQMSFQLEYAAQLGIASRANLGVEGAHRGAPHGSATGRLGTNPLTEFFPRSQGRSFGPDGTLLAIVEGKVKAALLAGKPVPDGCLITNDGPTNKAGALYQDPPESRGAIRPLGGDHRGYMTFGLSMMGTAFGSILGGAGYDRGGPAGQNNFSATFFNVRMITEFQGGTMDQVYDDVERFIAFIKDAKSRRGFGQVLFPAEKEQLARVAAISDGMEVDKSVVQSIFDFAEQKLDGLNLTSFFT